MPLRRQDLPRHDAGAQGGRGQGLNLPSLHSLPSRPNAALDWQAEALQQQLLPLLPGLSVQVLAHCTSTNTLLLERARATAQGTAPSGHHSTDTRPCLLVAEHQSQGRGRQGKAWQSALGASLTFSLALPLTLVDWSGLSLAVGLALADALDPPDHRPHPLAPAAGQQRARLGLKWPNDLLLLDAPAPAQRLRCPVQRLRYPVKRLRCPVHRLRYPAHRLRCPVHRLRCPVTRLRRCQDANWAAS